MKLIEIGRLRKPFGVKGHIKIEVKEQYEASLQDADVVFVISSDGDIPYFVEGVSLGAVPTVKFEEVDSPEQAAKLSMSSMALRADDVLIDAVAPVENSLLMLAGFDIYDKDVKLGVIDEVLEYPQQVMAKVIVDGEPVLIPLPSEFVSSIDLEGNRLVCDLPEGLVASQQQ